jgi:transposase
MDQGGVSAGHRAEGAACKAGNRAATQFDASPGATSVSLRERQRSSPVWLGLWLVDASVVADLSAQKFAVRLGLTAVGELLAKLGLTPQKPLQRAYQRDPEAIER